MMNACFFLASLDGSGSSIANGLMLFAIFGLAGIVMAILGYKLFDKFTPGDLHGEIFEKKNVAAAILAGSVIIGVSLILAAAMG
jgi:putative membrane protein